MCRNLIIHDADKKIIHEVKTIGELRALYPIVLSNFTLDGEKVITTEDDEYCLCSVDVETMAEQNGFELKDEYPDGGVDPFDHHWYKPDGNIEKT